MITVEAWELEYDDSYQNAHKFYRLFVPQGMSNPGQWIAQWGRKGAIGQFQGKTCVGHALAEDQARRQSEAKQAKGYTFVRRVRFDVTDVRVIDAAMRGDGAQLDRLFTIACGTSVDHEPPTPSSARANKENKAIAEMEATLRKMDSKLRAADPAPATKPAVEPAAEASPATEEPGSMEAKLAAALAQAKVKQ